MAYRSSNDTNADTIEWIVSQRSADPTLVTFTVNSEANLDTVEADGLIHVIQRFFAVKYE